MSLLDLTKATIVCAAIAFLFYSFPVAAQAVTIGVLSVLWLGYAYRAIVQLRRR